MMDQNKNDSNTSANNVLKEIEEKFISKIKIMQDPLTFKVFLLLLTYNELSLVELTQKVGKSKPTVFRHVQKLIEANFVQESREEKVRGSILAKFYRPKLENFAPSYALSPERLQAFSDEERLRLYKEICMVTGVTVNFIKSALDELQLYLDTKPKEEIPNYILAPDITLSLNMLSEKAYHKWIEIYQKAMMEFFQTMQAELMNPDIEKPYTIMLGILPAKKMYDRPRETPPEGENE